MPLLFLSFTGMRPFPPLVQRRRRYASEVMSGQGRSCQGRLHAGDIENSKVLTDENSR